MQIAKLSSKNQIVIPKEARESMDIKAHDKLLIVVKGGITIIMPKPKKYHNAISDITKGIYDRLYLKKERNSWKQRH